MRALLSIILICILPWQGFSQKKLALDPIPVNFVIRNAGLNVHGTIGVLEGFLTIDDQGQNLDKIEGSADPNTIQTGIELRDNHLKKADYFNVKEYPRIFMVSTGIKNNGNNKYTGDFDITIKDIRKNISVPFSFSRVDNTYVLKAEFSINRLDFKLGEKSIILSDQVKLKIDFKVNERR
jgi:polyisoprenoid-binding protein YceI